MTATAHLVPPEEQKTYQKSSSKNMFIKDKYSKTWQMNIKEVFLGKISKY
jgi:hypothetical protein